MIIINIEEFYKMFQKVCERIDIRLKYIAIAKRVRKKQGEKPN